MAVALQHRMATTLTNNTRPAIDNSHLIRTFLERAKDSSFSLLNIISTFPGHDCRPIHHLIHPSTL